MTFSPHTATLRRLAGVAAATTLLAACGTGGDDFSLAPVSTVVQERVEAPDASDESATRAEQGTAEEGSATTGPAADPAPSGGSEPERGPEAAYGAPDLSYAPHDDRERRTRPQQCLDLAGGPWSPVAYEHDPLQAIREGLVPGVPDGGDHLLFNDLVEYPTVDSYEDVSTLRDPAALARAWAAAGYDDGVMLEYLEGNYQFQVTAVRFRDAASAGEALSAHLQDYCHRSVEARALPAGNGVTVLRDHGAVRTLWVQGDVFLSTFVCVCFGDDDPSRQALVEQWAADVTAAIGPTPRRTETV